MEHVKLLREMEQLLHLFSNGLNPLHEDQFSFQQSSTSFCFYPGSFNPWHQGHTSCVELHQKHFPQIPLMILPDQNPQKDHQVYTQPNSTLFEHQPSVYLSFVLRQKNSKNPTYTWTTFLKKHCPKLQLGLLLGLDSYLSLFSWISYQDLLKSLDFIEVIPRKIENLASDSEEYLQKIHLVAPHLKIHRIQGNHFESVSSTQIRQK